MLTDKVISYAMWNLGKSFINAEGINLSQTKRFLLFCTFVRRRQHMLVLCLVNNCRYLKLLPNVYVHIYYIK